MQHFSNHRQYFLKLSISLIKKVFRIIISSLILLYRDSAWFLDLLKATSCFLVLALELTLGRWQLFVNNSPINWDLFYHQNRRKIYLPCRHFCFTFHIRHFVVIRNGGRYFLKELKYISRSCVFLTCISYILNCFEYFIFHLVMIYRQNWCLIL